MQKNSIRGRLFAGTVLAGAALAGVHDAYAQAAPADASVEEVVITGSRIRRAETETPAPVVVVSPEVFQDRGFVQAGQALNQVTSNIPQVPQASGSGAEAGSGQQYPNLFGLGPGRTLTLVNGRRMVTTSSGQFSANALGQGDRVVDTNIIPTGLIKRIDVVQAGGAAVYGSDAIAGVINYVLKDDFEGLELDGQYGESTRGDYPVSSLRATVGRNFLDGRANLALNMEWSKTKPLLDYDRPRSNLARVTASNSANTSNTDGIPALVEVRNAHFWEFNYNGLLFTPAPAPVPTFIFRAAGVPQQFSADGGSLVAYNPGTLFGVPFASGGDGYPYQELAALYVGVERFNANLIGHYDITDHIKFSGEVLVSDVSSKDPYGNSATNTILNGADTGFGAIPISRQNPYLTPAVRALLGPGGPPLFLSKAWTDLLYTREQTANTKTVRALAALDGDFDYAGRNFYWDVSFSHAEADGNQRGWGIWTTRFNNAVQAVSAGGSIVCGINADASTTNNDAACAPINPFGQNNVSDAARAYVNLRVGQDYLNMQDDFLATLGGDLVTLPAGKAKFSLAYEHRNESAKFVPLPALQAGLTEGQVPSAATSGSFNTDELSAEVLLPVIGGDFTLPFAKEVELDGSFRYVDNSLAGKEDVWGVGGRWMPFDGLTFRASRSRNFRAPTLDQLFAPVRTALGVISVDPCDADRINSGPNPAIRRANCTALFAANPGYGPLATFQDPSENFASAQITSGGNADLENEISHTTTYGFVFQPTFAPGLTVVIDRVEVDLKDGLSAFTAQDFLATCYDAAPQPADICATFTRGPTGAVTTARSTTFNAGSIKYRGEVYNVDYLFPIGRFFDDKDLGDLELQWEATHTSRLETSVTGVDLTRTDGTTATPDWRHQFDVRWHYGPVRLTYNMIYLPSVKVNRFDTIESTPTPDIKRNIRQSISGSYEFREYTLRAGIINITDEEPSFPTRNYGDILGRQWFVGLNARF